jgi:spore coat protein U-like protein
MGNDTGQFLSYRLWQEANHAQEWGDSDLLITTYPAPALQAMGDNNPIVYPIFGTVLMSEAPIGQYMDVVKVTLAYPPFGPNDQQTATLPLSIQKVGSCTIDAGGIIGFGSRPTDSPDLFGVALGAFSINCSSGIHYGIGIDAGQYFNGKQRYMSDGTHHIPYTLWANRSATQEWGDSGLNGIEPAYVETYPAPAQFGDGNGSPQPMFLWGDVALRSSNAPVGIYQDSVMVTIVW